MAVYPLSNIWGSKHQLGVAVNVKPNVLYYTKNDWNFSVNSLSESDYTQTNADTARWQFDMEHNNDSAWYIYDAISSISTEGGSYTTTKVIVRFDIQIGNKTDSQSNKFNIYLADSSSGTQTLLKSYTNDDNTGGQFIKQSITLKSGEFDISNDFINIKDNTTTGASDWDFTIKNLSIRYYGIPT
jgi:hypothetical protein